MKTHPARQLLKSILGGLASELRAVLHHLSRHGSVGRIAGRTLDSPQSKGSRANRKILFWRWTPPSYSFSDHRTGELRQRALAFDRERTESSAVLHDLLEQPEERQRELAASRERYRSLALCERLLELSREKSFESARDGEALAELAITISHHLDTRRYGPHIVRGLKARGWSEIGNSRRLRSDLSGAGDAFRRAQLFLGSSPDPMEVARFYNLKAALCQDQRRFDDSLRIRDRAIRIYRGFHQDHLVGRTLGNKASTYLEMGEPEKALETLQVAVQRLDPSIEPRMLLCARHNLALALAKLGHLLEAQGVVATSSQLYRLSPNPADDYRRFWLEGIIATRLGQLERAESALLVAREGFSRQESIYDVALIGLDLAAVYGRQDRPGDAKRLASQIVPIFASRNLQRETVAALSFLKQPTQRETTDETLRGIPTS